MRFSNATAVSVSLVASMFIGAACTSTPSTASPTASPSATAASATVTATSAAPAASSSVTPAASPQGSAAAARYEDATYTVEGRPVALVNGLSEVPAAPGSASKVTTKIFGNMAVGDLNGDGQADVAVILTQSSGGSGTFYYLVAALKTANGYVGTNAVALGDRVAPQPTTIEGGVAIANYAERKPGEPMTATPSVSVSKRLRVVDGKLVEAR